MSNLFLSYFSLLLMSRSTKRLVWHLAVIGLAFLFSLRTEVVPDTESYLNYYINPLDEIGLIYIENGFLYTCFLFNNILKFPFSFFLFISSFFLIELWLYVTRCLAGEKAVMPMMVLLFSFYGYFYFGIVLRNSWALVFIYLGCLFLFSRKTAYKRYIYFYLCILIAYLYHRSALFYIFLPLLLRDFKGIVYLIWLPVILLLFGVSYIAVSYISSSLSSLEGFDRLLSYTENADNNSISIIFIVTYLLAVCSAYFRKYINFEFRRKYVFFMNTILFGLTIYSVTYKLAGVNRLAQGFFFFSFFPVYFIIFQNQLFRNRNFKYVCFYSYSIINFWLLFYCNHYLFDGY